MKISKGQISLVNLVIFFFLQKMDSNKDGVVTREEFLECCRRDHNISASMAVFDSMIWPGSAETGNSNATTSKSTHNSSNKNPSGKTSVSTKNSKLLSNNNEKPSSSHQQQQVKFSNNNCCDTNINNNGGSQRSKKSVRSLDECTKQRTESIEMTTRCSCCANMTAAATTPKYHHSASYSSHVSSVNTASTGVCCSSVGTCPGFGNSQPNPHHYHYPSSSTSSSHTRHKHLQQQQQQQRQRYRRRSSASPCKNATTTTTTNTDVCCINLNGNTPNSPSNTSSESSPVLVRVKAWYTIPKKGYISCWLTKNIYIVNIISFYLQCN